MDWDEAKGGKRKTTSLFRTVILKVGRVAMKRSVMFKFAYPWGLWDVSSNPSRREWEISMTCPKLDHLQCSCCDGAHSVAFLTHIYWCMVLDVMFPFDNVLCHSTVTHVQGRYASGAPSSAQYGPNHMCRVCCTHLQSSIQGRPSCDKGKRHCNAIELVSYWLQCCKQNVTLKSLLSKFQLREIDIFLFTRSDAKHSTT